MPDNNLTKKFEKILNNWPEVKKDKLKDHWLAKFMQDELKLHIESIATAFDDELLVTASVGKGNWSDIPWIAILNPKITETTQLGIYPVFLFKSDGSGFYLALSQGTQTPEKLYGKKKALELAEQNKQDVFHSFPEIKAWGTQNIDLKATSPLGKSYEDVSIVGRFYNTTSNLNDSVINKDLTEILTFYKKIYKINLNLRNENSQNSDHDTSEKPLPLNRILYGPPGTGKTYKTTEFAVECVEPDWYQTWKQSPLPKSEKRQQIKSKYDDLVSKGRIAFTTFHQSFAYEDFVEGIRPSVNKDSDETSSLSYDVMPGVFKSLCTLASTNAKEQTGSTQSVDIDGKNIWKLSLGNTLEEEGEDIYNDCLDNNYVLLGWGDDIDFTGCDSRQKIIAKVEETKGISLAGDPYNYLVTAVNTFKNVIKKGDLIIISDGNHKFRAIAEVTGEYEFLNMQEGVRYQQSRKVKWHRVYDTSLPKEMLFEKSLSQMTLYNLKDGTINRDKLKELLTVEPNTDSIEKPHLLIIDEINRGNISRIFGELITLLEPDKRKGGSDAREVTLPYSKEKFSVPSNLYVLGTMNTADKSLAQIDFALRRRFEFIETLPDPSLLSDIEVFGIQLSDLLTVMNQRIEVLLDREHTIGHAYFWSLKDLDSDKALEIELANIFENRIIPLLQEYFFSDWERIGWVLNDPAKKPEHRFIQVGNLQPDVAELFHSSVTDQIMDRRYHINTEAFTMPEAYTGIVSVDTQAD